VSRGISIVLIALVTAIVTAEPAAAARPATPQERVAIATAVRRGVEHRWHRPASGVHDVRVSTVGPWALARLNRPLFRVPNSIALLALIGSRWTLVAESVTGAVCDEGESRAVDNDLDISHAYRLRDKACSAPTIRTQSCGRDLGGGVRITDIRATNLTCADAVYDEGGWVANVQFGGCRTAKRCRVVDRSSDILGFLCLLRPLHPAHSRRYLARVTCATPLQRLSFLLHTRL
jgi:hypothetical protein